MVSVLDIIKEEKEHLERKESASMPERMRIGSIFNKRFPDHVIPRDVKLSVFDFTPRQRCLSSDVQPELYAH